MKNYVITLSGEYESPDGCMYYNDFAEVSIRAVDYDSANITGQALAGTIQNSIYRSISWSVRDE